MAISVAAGNDMPVELTDAMFCPPAPVVQPLTPPPLPGSPPPFISSGLVEGFGSSTAPNSDAILWIVCPGVYPAGIPPSTCETPEGEAVGSELPGPPPSIEAT